MEPSRGKLVNKDGGELSFSVNPVDYSLSKGFEFVTEPCLGQSAPIISYRCGSLATLSFQLMFDKDADKNVDLKKVASFLESLNKVNDSTKSAPLVEFRLGGFSFKGFITQYLFQPSRFSNDGAPTSARLEMKMTSNGDYENGTH